MVFQHFRFLAPPSPHIYPSHLPSKASRLDVSPSIQKTYKNNGCLTILLSKVSIFRRRNHPKRTSFGDVFRSHRCVFRSLPLWSAPCPPSSTSKYVGNMCIICTGGFLGRLLLRICCHSDTTLTYLLQVYCYFYVTDTNFDAFFIFRLPFSKKHIKTNGFSTCLRVF